MAIFTSYSNLFDDEASNFYFIFIAVAINIVFWTPCFILRCQYPIEFR